MSQHKQISQFLNNVLSDDLANADTMLKKIVTYKIFDRIKAADSKLEEGFFDRLGANVAGVKAGLSAKTKNFGTKFSGGATAAKHAITGNFGKAANTLRKAQNVTNKNPADVAAKHAKLTAISNSIGKDLTALFPGDPAVSKTLAALGQIGKKSTKTPVAKPRNVP